MNFNGVEKRRHERVYFPPGHGVNGSFGLIDAPEETITVPILNLSLGGLYFTLKRSSPLLFNANDAIILNEFKTGDDFNLTANIILEVRRVENHGVVDFVGFGCQFVDIDANTRERMAKFIEWELKNIKNSVDSA